MDAQRISHPEQIADLHLLAGFHALQRVAGEFGGIHQPLLRPVELHAANTDAVANCLAGLDDPLGMRLRHGLNAAPKIILCQPQKWGDFGSCFGLAA